MERIKRYLLESSAGLTVEQYFELCETMGSEPIEEEIPVDRSTLSLDTQLVFRIYDKLQSNWEGMSGTYLGKDLSTLPMLFEIYDIEEFEQKYCLEIIPVIDSYVAEDIANKIKQKMKSKGDTPSGRR